MHMERRSATGPCIDITVDDGLPALKDVAAVIANSIEFQVLMSANRTYGLRLASAHQTRPRAAIEHNNSTAIVSGGTKVGALSSWTPLATFGIGKADVVTHVSEKSTKKYGLCAESHCQCACHLKYQNLLMTWITLLSFLGQNAEV